MKTNILNEKRLDKYQKEFHQQYLKKLPSDQLRPESRKLSDEEQRQRIEER